MTKNSNDLIAIPTQLQLLTKIITLNLGVAMCNSITKSPRRCGAIYNKISAFIAARFIKLNANLMEFKLAEGDIGKFIDHINTRYKTGLDPEKKSQKRLFVLARKSNSLQNAIAASLLIQDKDKGTFLHFIAKNNPEMLREIFTLAEQSQIIQHALARSFSEDDAERSILNEILSSGESYHRMELTIKQLNKLICDSEEIQDAMIQSLTKKHKSGWNIWCSLASGFFMPPRLHTALTKLANLPKRIERCRKKSNEVVASAKTRSKSLPTSLVSSVKGATFFSASNKTCSMHSNHSPQCAR
jgi:hypothetical protein